jgi:hypothetical protein
MDKVSAVELRCEGWVKARRFAVWQLERGEHVSVVVGELARWYTKRTGRVPCFAFMRQLPREAEEGMEVAGVLLFSAEWALPGCVLIGG